MRARHAAVSVDTALATDVKMKMRQQLRPTLQSSASADDGGVDDDGIPTRYCQTCWTWVRPEVMRMRAVVVHGGVLTTG